MQYTYIYNWLHTVVYASKVSIFHRYLLHCQEIMFVSQNIVVTKEQHGKLNKTKIEDILFLNASFSKFVYEH